MQWTSPAECGLKDRYVLCLTCVDPRWDAAGLERYLADETALLADWGMSVVCLFPFPTRKSKQLNRYLSRFWGVLADGMLQGFYDTDGILGLLAEWQRAGRVPVEIQLHHLKNWDLSQVEQLLCRIPVDVRLFLHDYFTVCPQYNLLRNSMAYCGAAPPSENKCKGCRWWTPGHLGAMRKVLKAAGSRLVVTAPSDSARQIWVSSFPEHESRTEVVPHLIPAGDATRPASPSRTNQPLRIAFVGSPADHKGWSVFSRLVEVLAQDNPGYVFYHFGRPARLRGSVIQVPVSFVREGPDAMTAAIRRAGIEVVLLWSIWPETYSYVLQESRMANAWVITNSDSGNIAATVRRDGGGRVLRDAGELLAYLQDIDQVRQDVDKFRTRSPDGAARMVPNPVVADDLASKPGATARLKGGSARRCLHVGGLYRLKRLKRKWWNRWT